MAAATAAAAAAAAAAMAGGKSRQVFIISRVKRMGVGVYILKQHVAGIACTPSFAHALPLVVAFSGVGWGAVKDWPLKNVVVLFVKLSRAVTLKSQGQGKRN